MLHLFKHLVAVANCMHAPAPPITKFPLAAAKLDAQRDGSEGPPSAQICRPCKEKEKFGKALSTCTVVEFNISTLSREMEALTCGELVSVWDGGVVLCLVVLVLSLCWCCWSPLSHFWQVCYRYGG